MHIGYFSTQLGTLGGPSVVDYEVLQELVHIDQKNKYTIYSVTPDATDNLELTDNFTVQQMKPSGKWPVVAFGMTAELMRCPVDLLHATFVPPLIPPKNYVLTMTCWSQFSEPEVYPPLVRWRLQYLISRGVKNSAAVFCYTDYLKEKVMEHFGLSSDRVFVTRPGLGNFIERVEDADLLNSFLQNKGITKPYILFIGSLTKRKNVPRLIRAYHQLVEEEGIEHQLVLVGETLFLADEIFETISNLGLKDRIVLTGRLPHSDLPALYTGADVFVFPTLSEGFGLPPLESQACGTPVAAARVSSVPEVVGDAAVMFDPYDVDDMSSAILRCISDEQERQTLISKGLKNSERYSWRNMAHELLDGYEAVYSAISS
jgi:glycosyltransferase involved in cell wall biosynthesis